MSSPQIIKMFGFFAAAFAMVDLRPSTVGPDGGRVDTTLAYSRSRAPSLPLVESGADASLQRGGCDMKTPRWKSVGVAGALMGALAFNGCGTMSKEQTWSMNTTERTPAAEGKVKVKAEKSGNTRVKVEVAHLAPPATVFEEASMYVVWLKPQTGDAQNVGVLRLGNDLKGELETRTAFKDFSVIVTAERDANVTIPSPHSVMNTQVVMPT